MGLAEDVRECLLLTPLNRKTRAWLWLMITPHPSRTGNLGKAGVRKGRRVEAGLQGTSSRNGPGGFSVWIERNGAGTHRLGS